MRARHAAGAEHTDDRGVLAREVFRAERVERGDAHVLEMAVVDHGERLAVLGAEEKDEAAIKSGLNAVFVLDAHAVALGPAHDVRLHADREPLEALARS